MPADLAPPPTVLAAPAPGRGCSRQIDSTTLLGPHGEVFIRHHGQVYRLRVTSQGKLILTK
jgi:hemin uptake protein HemP